MNDNQNLIFKDKIEVGQFVFSPSFGDGIVTSILEDGFYVQYTAFQFVYDYNGCLYPNGRFQSVFLK
jgi:hypothetical protein